METLTTILSVLFILVLFIGILFLAYLVTSIMGKKFATKGRQSGYITLLDQIYLGQDRSVVLVRIAEEIHLLGVTQHHIEKISTMPAEKLPPMSSDEPGNTSFSEIFKTTLKNNWGLGTGRSASKKGKSHNGET